MKTIKKIIVTILICIMTAVSLFSFSSCATVYVDSIEFNGVKYVRNEHTEMYFSDLHWYDPETGDDFVGATRVGETRDPTSILPVFSVSVYIDDLDVEQNVIHLDCSRAGVFYVKEGVDVSNVFDLELAYVGRSNKTSEVQLESGFKLNDYISQKPLSVSQLPEVLRVAKYFSVYLVMCPSLGADIDVYLGEGRIFLQAENDPAYYEVTDETFKQVMMDICFTDEE